ncbi:MAG: hypothetical protein LIP28_08355 [Deltaproteobacteria bacterium]|nr:hypothetical protein [Deltaproteobacteria bacterium]
MNIPRTGILCLGLVAVLALPALAADDSQGQRQTTAAPSISDEASRTTLGEPDRNAPTDASARRTINEGTSFDRDARNNVDGGQERRDLGNLGRQ